VTISVTNNTMPLMPFFSPVLHSTRPYSQSKSNTQRALMLPDEILRMSNEQVLVLLRGQKPLMLYKIIPDELPSFKKLTSVRIVDYLPEWKRKEDEMKSKPGGRKLEPGPTASSVEISTAEAKSAGIKEPSSGPAPDVLVKQPSNAPVPTVKPEHECRPGGPIKYSFIAEDNPDAGFTDDNLKTAESSDETDADEDIGLYAEETSPEEIIK